MIVAGQETIRSTIYYFLEFSIIGQEFSHLEGIEMPKQALDIVRYLGKKGISSEISMKIAYHNDKSGYRTKDSEYKKLTTEELETIVRTNPPSPSFDRDIIAQDITGVDIGF